MKTILRDDDSGVSEVVGTILILAMTVVLFSTIILWVGSIPAPTTQTRVDIRPSMAPVYDGSGTEIGVNITLLHRGVERLNPANTIIYVTWIKGTNPPQSDKVILHRFNALLPRPSGILDGPDIVWDIGERWVYVNAIDGLRSSDQISVLVVDIVKNIAVWSAQLTSDPGTRPPIFVSKWTDDVMGTPAIDPVQATRGFFLYANVFDQDNDLNKNSVWATITIWFGDASCGVPQKMHDNGVSPDAVAGDGIFTLGAISCMSPPFPSLSWDGSIILLNATDLKGHQTKTRLVMNVVEPFTQGEIQTIPTELWQYIGFAQIRTGEVWLTNLSLSYTTSNKYSPFRVLRSWLSAGALFHLQMANHGNTTIFIDGWTAVYVTNTQSASSQALYIVAPCDPTKAARSGGVLGYPGLVSVITDFKYARPGVPSGCAAGVPPAVLDINPLNQEKGGSPYELMIYNKAPFAVGSEFNWPSSYAGSAFLNILVSGMSGPVNMTYQQILSRWGPTYNPHDHLLDGDPSTRTQWYAQVIPFIGMVLY
jgi:flagellin-like protein